MANYFASLPAYRNPEGLDFSPLNQAVQNFGETNRANAMAEYQAGRNRVSDARAGAAESRAQSKFDDEKGKEALNQLAGIYQTIEEAPETERAGLYERLKPLYGSLAQKIPDFRTDLQQMGVDPNDHIAVGKLVVGRARGVRNEGANEFGKAGSVFQDASGNFYTAQFSANGERRIRPLDGMAPARGFDTVGDRVINKATGQLEGNVGSAIAGGERAKAVGKAEGEGFLNLPKAENALKEYELKNRFLLGDQKTPGQIDQAIQQATGWTTGFTGALAKQVPGTAGYDLSKTLVGIQSNLGFETLQQMRDNSPTGGALGQVTERELELLQSTWGSLEQSQSKEQFVNNLQRLKQIKAEFAVLKRQAYERDVQRFGAANVPNPDTGQKAGGTSAPANGGWGYIGPAP
jgi:hypothetical protein